MTESEALQGILEHPSLAAKMRIVGRAAEVERFVRMAQYLVTLNDVKDLINCSDVTCYKLLQGLERQGYIKARMDGCRKYYYHATKEPQYETC